MSDVDDPRIVGYHVWRMSPVDYVIGWGTGLATFVCQRCGRLSQQNQPRAPKIDYPDIAGCGCSCEPDGLERGDGHNPSCPFAGQCPERCLGVLGHEGAHQTSDHSAALAEERRATVERIRVALDAGIEASKLHWLAWDDVAAILDEEGGVRHRRTKLDAARSQGGVK